MHAQWQRYLERSRAPPCCSVSGGDPLLHKQIAGARIYYQAAPSHAAGSQISESLMVSYCSGLICSRARVSSYIIRGKSIWEEARLRMFGDSHLLWEHRAWLLFQAWKWRSRYEHTCTVLFLHRPRPSRTRAGVTQLSPVSTAKHPHQ